MGKFDGLTEVYKETQVAHVSSPTALRVPYPPGMPMPLLLSG